ncbi:hypothetical protein CHARACLAT_029761 [Characodon lateralis]|uniref:Uncharacterized protein n=1 Tax=Characodon lateralis TaxID=208331 RepID=A0ABU7CSE6_9TELE|nr:hypothetical protein [Characodon lateralis]
MAAADPSKSPNRQKTPAEEVETSGEQAAAAESGCSPNQTNEGAGDKTGGCEPGAEDVGRDGGGCVASHSGGVRVESGAGAADKTTCVLPEHRAAAEKMAEALDNQQQAFDWSEAEDDEEGAKPRTKKKDKSAFSSQDERTPGKEEEIGKDGTVWTVIGEGESRGRRQSLNALTERQIQDS